MNGPNYDQFRADAHTSGTTSVATLIAALRDVAAYEIGYGETTTSIARTAADLLDGLADYAPEVLDRHNAEIHIV